MLTYKQIEELDADALFDIERKGVHDGWQDIIETCHKALRASSPDYKPVQIKEKFGTLRFYVQGVAYGEPEYQPILDAEAASETTCEDCGETGKVVSVLGWWRCVCDDDYQANLRRRAEAATTRDEKLWFYGRLIASDATIDGDNTAVEFLEAGLLDKHGKRTDKGEAWAKEDS